VIYLLLQIMLLSARESECASDGFLTQIALLSARQSEQLFLGPALSSLSFAKVEQIDQTSVSLPKVSR